MYSVGHYRRVHVLQLMCPMCLSLTPCFCAESQAQQLVALDLSSTGLTQDGMPDLLRQLQQRFASVQVLQLGNAFVDETVFEFICHNFRCLTSLNVRNNPLVNVPPVVSLLTKLQSLDVSACQSLSSFPDEILNLQKTLLSIKAKHCTEITFPPPSIVKRGAKDIFEYIKNAQGRPPLRRVKVMFLGNGRTGKTSLLSALAKQPLRPGDAGPDSTVGVTVNTLGKKLQPGIWESWYKELPEITFWDFAGQLEYSAAHDFFLSTRQAVYVIVFSVMEDRESQMNQVAYWLRTVATRGASEYVRFLMVGTKVDMIEGEWSDVEKKLQSLEADMKSVVRHCCGAAAVLLTRFNFVTSMGTHSEYERLRKGLKRNIQEFCKSIFEGDNRKLRFPKEYSDMRSEILKLSSSVTGLPMLELKSISHGPLKDVHKNSQMMGCLRVLHDVGYLILYESEDEAGARSQSICLKPQFVADVIAEFAESNRNTELQRGCARAYLEDLLKAFLGKTKALSAAAGSKEDPKSQTSQNVKKLFEFLLALRVFVPVYAAVDAETSARQVSSDFIVPSALKGRPSFWREVFGLKAGSISSISSIRGVRYMCLDRMITVAAFVRAMTALCSHPNHMWGCAFLFQMHKGAHLFVRLAESRAYIDVIVLGDDLSQLSGESVNEACVRVTMMLRCNLDAPLWLCPQCCASDMFARSGAAHAFHREQLFAMSTVEDDRMPLHVGAPPLPSDNDPGGPAAFVSRQGSARRSSVGGRASALSCSRFHEVSQSAVLYGQSVGSVGGRGMPALYPLESAAVRDALPAAVRVRDTLSWIPVSCCGLAEAPDRDGEVLPNSFFVLSLQLREGDKMCAQSMRVIDSAIRSSAKTCVVQEAKQPLKLELSAGDCIGSNVIEYILPCSRVVEIKSVAAKGVVTTKQAHSLRVDDQVLLSVRFDANGSAVEGVHCKVSEVINDDQLVLARVDPAGAAALPLAPDVTIMPMCSSFSAIDNVLVVYKRINPDGTAPFALFPGETNALHILRLQPSDCSGSNEAACWREVEDNWAIMLGHEFQNYEITGMTLFRCEEREKLFLQEVEQLESIRWRRPPPDFSCALDDEKQKTERAVLQQQVMGHFSDFSQKFSLLPVAENTDVNLSVAWWGKWPAVYHGVAQNGFWNLPSHLKIDPGYFGEGFYLTRYPRYSDYYINGFRS
jgi:GTPase SAR1 family protein